MGTSTLLQTYRWTRARYERAAELGVLADQRVELIGGQIVAMSPKGPRHEALAELTRIALASAFPTARTYVRKEAPLALGEWDEPEPDAAVVTGQPRDYLTTHPTAAQTLLVVEVADTTRGYDLGQKADIYAAAGITDYWVILPAEGEVIVCRNVAPEPASETKARYAERQAHRRGDSIVPLAADGQPVPVTALLP